MTTATDKIGIVGTHTFSFYSYHEEQDAILGRIDELAYLRLQNKEQAENEYFELKKRLERFKTKELVVKNKIVNTGLNALAERLAKSNGTSGTVNFTAIGTGSGAVNVNDTKLGVEIFRKPLNSGTSTNNSTFLEMFINPTELTGNFEEYGNFIDATPVPDSGILFNRFLEPVNKSNSESLNILSQITFNSL